MKAVSLILKGTGPGQYNEKTKERTHPKNTEGSHRTIKNGNNNVWEALFCIHRSVKTGSGNDPGFLIHRSYWTKGRPVETIRKSIKNSLCFGSYDAEGKQVGFGRVVTDFSVFTRILDVFILEEYKGKGLGKMHMKEIMEYPELQSLKRWGLGTHDAQGSMRNLGLSYWKNQKPGWNRETDRATKKE